MSGGNNAPRKSKTHIHRTFDDLVDEAGMLPTLQDSHEIIPKNDLEGHFLNVAAKHGVIDEMFSERFLDEGMFEEEDWF